MSKPGDREMMTKAQCAEMRKDLDGCVYSRRELEALLDSYEASIRAMRDEINGDGHTEGCAFVRCFGVRPCDCCAPLVRQYDGELQKAVK